MSLSNIFYNDRNFVFEDGCPLNIPMDIFCKRICFVDKRKGLLQI